MQLKISLLLQILMGLWVILHGFFVGEMGWVYSVFFWFVGLLLFLGGCAYWIRRYLWRMLSMSGMLGLALISSSFLIYILSFIFRGDEKFGGQGLYPFGIFAYSIFMIFHYGRSVSSLSERSKPLRKISCHFCKTKE